MKLKARWALNRIKVKRNKRKLNKVHQQTKERLMITLHYQYVMLCLLLVFDILVPSKRTYITESNGKENETNNNQNEIP